MPSILIVDDKAADLEVLKLIFQPMGYNLKVAGNVEEALMLYGNEPFDIVLSSINMAPVTGMDLLKQIREKDESAFVILMTDNPTMDSAVKALKLGASDYLLKPIKMAELMAAVKRGLAQKESAGKEITAEDITYTLEDCFALIGESPSVVKVRKQVEKLANSKTSLLIQGPPGTMKPMVAKLIHQMGPMRGGKMIELDCRSEDPEKLSGILVGEEGQGGSLLQEAVDGSLFLQHIESLPLDLQNSMALVFRSFGNKVHFICATDVDLEEKVDDGDFSVDLFYRIALSVLTLPPLNERKADMGLLVRHVMDNASVFQIENRSVEFAEDAISSLMNKDWKNNLDELVQVVSRAAANAKDRKAGAEQIEAAFSS